MEMPRMNGPGMKEFKVAEDAVVINVEGTHGTGDMEDSDVDAMSRAMEGIEIGSQESQEELEEEEKKVELPMCVRRRIRALRKNQVALMQTESEFFKELQQLEIKYEQRFKGHLDKRQSIIIGTHEPNEEECDFGLGFGSEEGLGDQKHAEINPESSKDDDIVGVPHFWLTIFRSVRTLSALIETHDLPILGHLVDVRSESTTDPQGFKILFHFSENEFFSNPVLTKTYTMKYDLDSANPLGFDGPEIIACKGCKIDWKEGKDVTVTVEERKQKHKRTGAIRTVTKPVKLDSFFNFFSPPEPDEEDSYEDDVVDLLNEDFELGQYFRERIIPRAILYFTGEAQDDDEEYETSSEEDTEKESSESSDDIGKAGDHAEC